MRAKLIFSKIMQQMRAGEWIPVVPFGHRREWTIAGRNFSAFYCDAMCRVRFEINGTRYEITRHDFANRDRKNHVYEWGEYILQDDDLAELMLLI